MARVGGSKGARTARGKKRARAHRENRTVGFTLIELLIVVAIIGILAAIALPNFLEAQVRAKVGRVKADMHSVATAMEAYAVDHNFYVITDWPFIDFPSQMGWETPRARLFGEWGIVWRLTTPVSYISTWPVDPFRYGTMDFHDGMFLDYYMWENYRELAAGLELIRPNMRWFVFSNGPDREMQGGMEYLWGAHYDGSNGTISTGNIVRFGP